MSEADRSSPAPPDTTELSDRGAPSPPEGPGLTVLLGPDPAGRTRALRLPRAQLRRLAPGAVLLALALLFLIASWPYLAFRAREAGRLEEQVAELMVRETQVAELARTLDEVEAAYARLRSLFGSEAPSSAGSIWLPPPSGQPTPAARGTDEGRPTSWPLTESGFVTQTLLGEPGVAHPGIDIAVPVGSYIRAPGPGIVTAAGEDPVYGRFLALEHADGYSSRLAHASILLVQEGDSVRRHEIIGLSGSSGRSTAPHLHFEIRLDGEPIDPLSIVVQP